MLWGQGRTEHEGEFQLSRGGQGQGLRTQSACYVRLTLFTSQKGMRTVPTWQGQETGEKDHA